MSNGTQHTPYGSGGFSRFSYVVDERDISRRVGGKIPVPIRVFTLEGLGVDQQAFLGLMVPAFSLLHLDPYDAKRNKVNFLKACFPEESKRLDHFLVDYYAGISDLEAVPDLIERLSDEDRRAFDRLGMTGRRKRAIAKFVLELGNDDDWNVERAPAEAFTQAVDDIRALTRKFREAPKFVTDHGALRKFLTSVATMVKEQRPEVRKLEVTMHMMFIFADALLEGDNSPEGIHQDGADYIVSALVIERAGVLGGESVVYDGNAQQVYLRHTLAVGQGLFQDDRSLWHDVTPITEDPSVPPEYGNRSIVGFDINIME